MSENKNTAIPVNELEDLQEKEFILHELQKSAKIGWWKVNFNTHEIICSDYIMDILDLSKNTMTVEEFLNIINVEHRQRISSSFIHIRTQSMENYGFIPSWATKSCGKTTRLSPSDFPRYLMKKRIHPFIKTRKTPV